MIDQDEAARPGERSRERARDAGPPRVRVRVTSQT